MILDRRCDKWWGYGRCGVILDRRCDKWWGMVDVVWYLIGDVINDGGMVDVVWYLIGDVINVGTMVDVVCYLMTWLGTARILYLGILRCRSSQCKDLPYVAMCILLLLVTSTMVSWQHQQQTMDIMMSQSYMWHHNGLECCDIINMPYYRVMAPTFDEWVILYTSLYMWCHYYNKNSAHCRRW